MNPTNGQAASARTSKSVYLRDIPSESSYVVATLDERGYIVPGQEMNHLLSLMVKLIDHTKSAAQKNSNLLTGILSRVRDLRAALAPDPDPKVEKGKREAESRKRAWEAYKKAGGTMALEGEGELVGEGQTFPPYFLSVRSRKAIRQLNITSIEELAEKTPDEMLDARNFGMSSLLEIRQYLAKRGLTLKGDTWTPS